MNNAKHAPGPWHVAEWEVRDNDGAIEAGGWQVVGADGYAINTCISEGDGDQEEANLHFIVRACNAYDQLFALLKAADNKLEAMRHYHSGPAALAIEGLRKQIAEGLAAAGSA